MLVGLRVISKGSPLSTIFLIASIFGALAFLYSFFGFFSNGTTPRFDTFGSLTPQEIGGHFLFGYIVALPTRNLKLGVLSGLMALTIDADHLLNAAGFETQGRMGHSISFALLSSVLIGFMASQIFRKIVPLNRMITPTLAERSPTRIENKIVVTGNNRYSSLMPPDKKSTIFCWFLIITLAAYMSHIAYDVFVDAGARFPLLAPFKFGDVFIPQIYALPIEGTAILLVYLWSNDCNNRIYSNHS